MTTTPTPMIKHDGVFATIVCTESHSEAHGDPMLVAIAQVALGMFDKTKENQLRVICGERTVTAMRTMAGVVAIVTTTGHPVMKSAKRMMKRTLRAQAKSRTSPSPSPSPSPSQLSMASAGSAITGDGDGGTDD